MPGDWLDRHTSRAPDLLRARVREHLGATPGAGLPGDDPAPETLAAAGRRALDRVLRHAGDRSVALDLLAADALLTLALLAQAQREPGGLRDFASTVLRAVSPPV